MSSQPRPRCCRSRRTSRRATARPSRRIRCRYSAGPVSRSTKPSFPFTSTASTRQCAGGKPCMAASSGVGESSSGVIVPMREKAEVLRSLMSHRARARLTPKLSCGRSTTIAPKAPPQIARQLQRTLASTPATDESFAGLPLREDHLFEAASGVTRGLRQARLGKRRGYCRPTYLD